MNSQYERKKCSIFISSTFLDMQSERKYLMNRVFPELKSWCTNYWIDLEVIDLRWGIREEDAKRKSTVRICLENIKKSTPFFLCLTGERRGWIPQRNDIDDQTLEEFPFVEEQISKLSATELEIFYVTEALKGKQHKCLFLKRDSAFISELQEETKKRKYQCEDAKSIAWKPCLNKETYDQAVYSCHVQEEGDMLELDDFCVGEVSLKEYLLEYYKREIQREYPERFCMDAKSAEYAKEEYLIQKAAENYAPDEFVEKSLDKYLNPEYKSNVVTLVRARSGEGLRAEGIMAHWLVQNRSIKREKVRLFYYIQEGTMKDVCRKMIDAGIIPEINIKDDEKLLRKFLWRSIKYYNQDKLVVVVLHSKLIAQCSLQDLYEVMYESWNANACSVRILSWTETGNNQGDFQFFGVPLMLKELSTEQKRRMIEKFYECRLKRISEEHLELLLSVSSYRNLILAMQETLLIESYEEVTNAVSNIVYNNQVLDNIFDRALTECPIPYAKRMILGLFFKSFMFCRINLGNGMIKNIACSLEEYVQMLTFLHGDLFSLDEVKEAIYYLAARTENVWVEDSVVYLNSRDLNRSITIAGKKYRLSDLFQTEEYRKALLVMCFEIFREELAGIDEKKCYRIISQIPMFLRTFQNGYEELVDHEKVCTELLSDYQYVQESLQSLGYHQFLKELKAFSGEMVQPLTVFFQKNEKLFLKDTLQLPMLLTSYFGSECEGMLGLLVTSAREQVDCEFFLRPCESGEEETMGQYQGRYRPQMVKGYHCVLGGVPGYMFSTEPLYDYVVTENTESSGNTSYEGLKAQKNGIYILKLWSTVSRTVLETHYFQNEISAMSWYENGVEYHFADGTKQKWLFTMRYELAKERENPF